MDRSSLPVGACGSPSSTGQQVDPFHPGVIACRARSRYETCHDGARRAKTTAGLVPRPCPTPACLAQSARKELGAKRPHGFPRLAPWGFRICRPNGLPAFGVCSEDPRRARAAGKDACATQEQRQVSFLDHALHPRVSRNQPARSLARSGHTVSPGLRRGASGSVAPTGCRPSAYVRKTHVAQGLQARMPALRKSNGRSRSSTMPYTRVSRAISPQGAWREVATRPKSLRDDYPHGGPTKVSTIGQSLTYLLHQRACSRGAGWKPALRGRLKQAEIRPPVPKKQ